VLRFTGRGEKMGRCFSVERAEESIINTSEAKEEFKRRGVSLIEELKTNHVVMEWSLGQPSNIATEILRPDKATSENISALDGLWAMCAKHGIELDEEQKIALYQDFLDD
jgi:hypothetical protein